jgi:hypothetical protein
MIVWAPLVAGATAVFGQAFTPQVDFNNNRTYATAADRDIYGYHGTVFFPLVGTQYRAQLYYGANADSLQAVTAAPASFRDPANIPAGSPLPGTWIGGTRVLTGFVAGEIVILQVRIWDSNTGADHASAAVRGQSMTFTYQVPPSGALPSAQYMENFRSFSIGIIPEPSVIGLIVIGAGALLLAYRQRGIVRDNPGKSKSDS